MHYRRQLLFTVTSALVLAACAKDQVNAPALPTGVSRSLTAAASCDIATIRANATAWFKKPQAVRERISAMTAAYTAGGAVGATNAGFDVLREVQVALAAGDVIGSATTGDLFVSGVLGCMSVGTLPAGFDVSGALGPNGLFAVVGGLGDPTGAITSRGTPLYGAEPPAGGSWYASGGNQRYLLYGYERPFAGFTPETPAAVTAFELATVPTPINFSPAIAGGMCQTTATNSQLQSNSAILAPVTLGFCTGITQSEYQGTGLFAAARRAAASLFTPAPLFAGVGGTGGLLSGLSPKGAVTFVPAATGITFVQQPVDTKRSLRPQFAASVSVLVTTENGTSVGGVLVTITAVNNKGSWTPFNNTAVTGSNGIAVFPDLYFDKSGGYNLVASGVVFGQPTKSATSNRINISGL
jgi:hypothetical protein